MILNIVTNAHLSLCADSKFIWDKYLITFGEMLDHWVAFQDIQLTGPSAEI